MKMPDLTLLEFYKFIWRKFELRQSAGSHPDLNPIENLYDTLGRRLKEDVEKNLMENESNMNQHNRNVSRVRGGNMRC